MSTKGLCYIQIRENAVRENVQKSFIKVEHIAGKRNTSDMFTKEDKEPAHYIEIRDTMQDTPPQILLNIDKTLTSWFRFQQTHGRILRWHSMFRIK